MKGKFLFLALSAMALVTGCSNDETTEINNGNTIDFSVTAGKLTRATATTTNNIKEFQVWAYTDNGKTTYMTGTKVTGGNGKWTYTGTKFWPETQLDFLAISPIISSQSTAELTQNTNKVINYVVEDGKIDLLYAANYGEKKEDHKTAPVKVNFRHALSQIVLKAKLTENSTIDVKVKGVKIDGVQNNGNLYLAKKNTAPNIDAEGNTDTETGDTWGKWGYSSNRYATYTMDFGEKSLGNEAIEIGEPLFLLPQTLNPWLTLKGDSAKITGKARLLINCQIVDKESGKQLWPASSDEDGFAEVAISLDNPKNDPNRDKSKDNDEKHDKWMQGKKYIYTLIFGEGGGYNPGPDPNPDPNPDPTPDPVLVPVKFEVTVDEFQNGGEYDYPANHPENP